MSQNVFIAFEIAPGNNIVGLGWKSSSQKVYQQLSECGLLVLSWPSVDVSYHVISTLFNILLSAKLPVSFW